MEIVFTSIDHTTRLVFRMGTIMFISLFGVELLMQLGLMKYLKPLGKPVAKLANLPSESALTFLAGIGSMIAAHTMSAKFHTDGRITDRELILSGVLNTVPFHFKESLTRQLPMILPLLGLRLCLIYIAAFWLAGLLKICFVVGYGRWRMERREEERDAFDALECNPEEQDCSPRSFRQLLRDTWNTRKKMFRRMLVLLASVTLIIQLLVNSGAMGAFEALILPLTSLFQLPPVLVGPLSTYILSPMVGITYISNLLVESRVTEFQTIVALMAAGMLSIPISRLRRTLPRYTAIFGVRFGPLLCGLTAFFSMMSRMIVLVLVLLFFR